MLFTVPRPCADSLLLQGDRVLVDRWAYGYRLPGSNLWGYHRLGGGVPKAGEWVVFNHPLVQRGALPDTSRLCFGRVLACPGDTVWMGRGGRVSRRRDYVRGHIWPIPVPARGAYIEVAPWAARIYQFTQDMHEADSASLRWPDSYETILHSRKMYVRFSRNYYWLSSGNEEDLLDSRSFGFVPEEFFLGRASRVLYSVRPDVPWYKCLRPKRYFSPL